MKNHMKMPKDTSYKVCKRCNSHYASTYRNCPICFSRDAKVICYGRIYDVLVRCVLSTSSQQMARWASEAGLITYDKDGFIKEYLNPIFDIKE